MNGQATLLDVDTGGVRTIHVMMPSMAFACGRSIVGSAHQDRGFVLGSSDWHNVTCPDCLAIGREQVAAEVARQQGRQA